MALASGPSGEKISWSKDKGEGLKNQGRMVADGGAGDDGEHWRPKRNSPPRSRSCEPHSKRALPCPTEFGKKSYAQDASLRTAICRIIITGGSNHAYSHFYRSPGSQNQRRSAFDAQARR